MEGKGVVSEVAEGAAYSGSWGSQADPDSCLFVPNAPANASRRLLPPALFVLFIYLLFDRPHTRCVSACLSPALVAAEAMELTDLPNMAWALFLQNRAPTTAMPARRTRNGAPAPPEPPTPAAKGARGKIEPQTELYWQLVTRQRERNLARASECALNGQ